MGRAEAFAMQNSPIQAIKDGLGNAFGYSAILVLVAFFREVIGSGKVYGITVVPDQIYALGYADNGLMLLAPGAFFVLGLLAWFQNTITGSVEE